MEDNQEYNNNIPTIYEDEDGNQYTHMRVFESIVDMATNSLLCGSPFGVIGQNAIENFGDSLNGVFIPDSVKKNQKIGRCPQEFIDGVKRASQITGIPVSFYIAFGALESGWKNCAPNSSGYGGYFGQKPNQGGKGSVFEQAQGIMVDIYKSALSEAKKHNWSGADLAVWCYLCHNAGNAGAKTMLNSLGGNLRHNNIEAYQQAAQAFVNAYGKKWSQNTQLSQVKEKTLSIPKAYYIVSQIS